MLAVLQRLLTGFLKVVDRLRRAGSPSSRAILIIASSPSTFFPLPPRISWLFWLFFTSFGLFGPSGSYRYSCPSLFSLPLPLSF